MVLEINKAIMYLKIRSSFTITKKKRKNTPNVPELGGMTHLQKYTMLISVEKFCGTIEMLLFFIKVKSQHFICSPIVTK